MNVNERSPMKEFTACDFGSTYAFHLIAEGLTVRRFSGIILPDLPFCRYKALRPPTLFSMTLRIRLPDAFHHLVVLYLVYRPVCKMVLTEFLSGIKFVGP